MPPPPDAVRRPAGVSRRTAVGGSFAAAALTVAGCTSGSPTRPVGTPRETVTSGEQDPDVALAATVLGDEQRVLDLVRATTERHPRLATVLSAVQAAHRAHVDLLTEAVPEEQRPTAAPEPTVPDDRVAPRPAAALATLVRREDRLALVGRRAALGARSGAFARVLASMAAGAAQHASVLRSAGKPS